MNAEWEAQGMAQRKRTKPPDRVKTFLMRDAVCPFVKALKGKCVECEAPMDKAKLVLQFRTANAMEEHARTYCGDHYKYCEVYRMVMDAKYED